MRQREKFVSLSSGLPRGYCIRTNILGKKEVFFYGDDRPVGGNKLEGSPPIYLIYEDGIPITYTLELNKIDSLTYKFALDLAMSWSSVYNASLNNSVPIIREAREHSK